MNGISKKSERTERHFIGSKIAALLGISALISVSGEAVKSSNGTDRCHSLSR